MIFPNGAACRPRGLLSQVSERCFLREGTRLRRVGGRPAGSRQEGAPCKPCRSEAAALLVAIGVQRRPEPELRLRVECHEAASPGGSRSCFVPSVNPCRGCAGRRHGRTRRAGRRPAGRRIGTPSGACQSPNRTGAPAADRRSASRCGGREKGWPRGRAVAGRGAGALYCFRGRASSSAARASAACLAATSSSIRASASS